MDQDQLVQLEVLRGMLPDQVDLRDLDLGLVVRKDLVRGREPPMDMVLDLEDLTDMDPDLEVPMDMDPDLADRLAALIDMDPGLEVPMDTVQGQGVLCMDPGLESLLRGPKDMGQDQEVLMDMLLDPEVLLEDLLQVSIRHTHNIQDMGIKAERQEDILDRLEDTLEHLLESTLELQEDTLDILQWEVLEHPLHQAETGLPLLPHHQTKNILLLLSPKRQLINSN